MNDSEKVGDVKMDGRSARLERRILRLWLVDDCPQLREIMAEFFSNHADFTCKRQFPSAEVLLATLAEERPPDMILLDVNLQGKSGLSAIRPILQLAPSVRVVMMTTFTNSHYELEAYNSGASGFLLKSYDPEQMVQVLVTAYRTPGARELFPNMIYHEQRRAATASAPAPTESAHGLLGNLRRFVRSAKV